MLDKTIEGVKDFLKTPFNKYLAIGLLFIALALFALEPKAAQEPGAQNETALVMHFFYSSTCSHCAAQKIFNEKITLEFPGVKIISHNVELAEEWRNLVIMAQNYGINSPSGVPVTFIGNSTMIEGFEAEQTTGEEIRNAIRACLEENCSSVQHTGTSSRLRNIEIPLIGNLDLSSAPLLALAVVLGLVDGFNPCAMWVLVYLIGVTINLKDRGKMKVIVGTFLLVSGILYFLFMTAWLNAFLFLGYVRAVTIIVGAVAVGGGMLSIKEFIDTKGQVVCKVETPGERKKLSRDIQEIASSPLVLSTFIAIVALAFVINSVEFVCSSAIPMIFTQTLALSKLSFLEYYGYILLYDFFFMLDDLIIFSIAIFMLSGEIGEKYAGYSKIIGGAILLLLGLMLLFAPRMLS